MPKIFAVSACSSSPFLSGCARISTGRAAKKGKIPPLAPRWKPKTRCMSVSYTAFVKGDKMRAQRNQASFPLVKSGERHYNKRCGAAEAAVYECCLTLTQAAGYCEYSVAAAFLISKFYHKRFFPKLQEAIEKKQSVKNCIILQTFSAVSSFIF